MTKIIILSLLLIALPPIFIKCERTEPVEEPNNFYQFDWHVYWWIEAEMYNEQDMNNPFYRELIWEHEANERI